jgi:hypothetical protein
MNRVIVPARQATLAGGIHSLESIPGFHKRLKIRVLVCRDPWCRTRASVLHRLEDLPKTSIIICFCNEAWSTLVRYTLQPKSHLCIPFPGIAQPQSQFPHSCVYERFPKGLSQLPFVEMIKKRKHFNISPQSKGIVSILSMMTHNDL